MSINIGIIGQRVRKLAGDLAGQFEILLNIRNDEVINVKQAARAAGKGKP